MKEKVATLSILANAILAGGKITVGLISNSSAIMAAGIDSFVDIFSSVISFIGIKISKKPADKKHPYGHYKFEVLGGILVTIIILATGIGIIYNAFQDFSEPRKIEIGYLAFGIMIFSSVVNEIMARLKIYYGKKENSVSLLSDGIHSRIDVYTSLTILIGLFLTSYWINIDVFLALLMGAYITKEALSIGKEAADSLLDVSAGEEVENAIKEIIKTEKIKLISLKTQKKGWAASANLEIDLPSNLKLEEATKISSNLKDKLINKIENLQYVVIQISSHKIESNFYRPAIGRGFGWQRKKEIDKDFKKGLGKGPEGNCVCPKCGYEIPHTKGIPCSNTTCPNCNISLERK